MKNNSILAIVLMFLLVSVFLFLQRSNVPEISSSVLIEWMEAEEEIVVLDVRKPEELDGEHGQIESVINIPVQELEERIAELEPFKEKKIAVICRSGNRSQDGTAILIENGFNAFNVEGGMKAYNKASKK